MTTSRFGQEAVQVNRPVYTVDSFDLEYGYSQSKRDVSSVVFKAVKKRCTCSKQRLRQTIFAFFPILTWVQEYDWKSYPVNDILAGLTVGVMSIPQGMSYAGLVGVPVEYGLYTNLVPTALYVIFGTSRIAGMGAVAVTSLMLSKVRYQFIPDPGTHLSQGCHDLFKNISFISNLTSYDQLDPNIFDSPECFTSWQLAISTTMLMAFILLIMGLLRLGFVSNYLSDYVVGGFTSAATIHVLTSQIDYVFGFRLPRRNGVGKIIMNYIDLFKHIAEVNPATVVCSFICIVTLFFIKETLNPRFQKLFRVPIPGELLAVIAGVLVSHFAKLSEKYNVGIVAHIPDGFPKPIFPRFDLMHKVIPDAFALAIVNYSLSVSLTKLYAKKHNYKIDPNQEFTALGIINFVGSIFQSYVAGQIIARSLVFDMAGGKSQFAGLIGTSLVIITILWMAPYLAPLPQCVLGSIIFVACFKMLMQMRDLKKLFVASKIDFSIYLVTFLAVLILDVSIGLASSVAYAFFTTILRTQWPKIRLLARVGDTDLYAEAGKYNETAQLAGLAIYSFNAPLYYANVGQFLSKLFKSIRIDPDCFSKSDANAKVIYHVVVDCSGFLYIDLMGVNALKQIYTELGKVGITVVFAGYNDSVRSAFDAASFYETVSKNHLFMTVHDAVIAFCISCKNGDSCREGTTDVTEQNNITVQADIVELETISSQNSDLPEDDRDYDLNITKRNTYTTHV